MFLIQARSIYDTLNQSQPFANWIAYKVKQFNITETYIYCYKTAAIGNPVREIFLKEADALKILRKLRKREQPSDYNHIEYSIFKNTFSVSYPLPDSHLQLIHTMLIEAGLLKKQDQHEQLRRQIRDLVLADDEFSLALAKINDKIHTSYSKNIQLDININIGNK